MFKGVGKFIDQDTFFHKISNFRSNTLKRKLYYILTMGYFSVESKGVIFRKGVRLALLTDNLPRIKCTIGFLTPLQTTTDYRISKIHDLSLALSRDI